MVKIWVGVTDNDWFDFLRRVPGIDEVNFWQPSGFASFKAIEPGSLFVFKLKAPRNVIGGFGVFSHSTTCPVSLAWEAFGIKNGAPTFEAMRRMIASRRNQETTRFEDFTIGCRIVTSPVFFNERGWLPVPRNWLPNIVVGKTYDSSEPEGRQLWEMLYGYVELLRAPGLKEEEAPFLHGLPPSSLDARYGEPDSHPSPPGTRRVPHPSH
jgi:putative restriction endonuclease